jgi:hypothetical protein
MSGWCVWRNVFGVNEDVCTDFVQKVVKSVDVSDCLFEKLLKDVEIFLFSFFLRGVVVSCVDIYLVKFGEE